MSSLVESVADRTNIGAEWEQDSQKDYAPVAQVDRAMVS